MGFFDGIMGKKKGMDKITLITMQAYQMRCIYDGKCPQKILVHNRKWCGLDSRIDFNCPSRLPSEE